MDGNTLRLLVVVLGVVACLCVVGMVWLESLGHTPPPNLGTLAGAALGALGTLLVNPRGSERNQAV